MKYDLRLRAVVDAVEAHGSRGLIVDAACAQGNFALRLADRGWRSVGVDLRLDYLAYAQLKMDGENVAWAAGSVEALPLKEGIADAVLLGEILEHVAFPERVLAEAFRVARPGGLVIATTPNGGFIRSRLGSLGDVNDRRAIEEQQFEPDSDGHLFLMTRDELVVLGTGVGLVLIDHRYFHAPPVTGWPRAQRLAERLPVAVRLRAENAIQARTGLARRLSFGQLAVFRRPAL